MKKTGILVLTIPLLFAGCSGEESTQRDVYKTFEDCMADWGQN